MSTTTINLNNVTRVDWNGEEDNITEIRLKKGNKTTVIWNKPQLATFNVTLVRDKNSFSTNNAWAVGRIGSYAGRPFVTPTIRYGGFGYRVGGVYEVQIPRIVFRNAHGAGNEGWLRQSHTGSAAKPMLYYVSKVSNTDNPNGTTTRGASGAIMSGRFLMFPSVNTPTNAHISVNISRSLSLAQKYRFRRNVVPNQYLYNYKTDSWTAIGTAEDPTNVSLPTAVDGNISGKAYRYSNSGVRSSDFFIPLDTYNSNELQNHFAQEVDWGNVTGSDIRIKENIEFTGLSNSGLKIYEFDYIDKPGRYQGVMAQDLLEINSHHPAVVTDENGHYSVDYNYTDVEFKKIK